MGVGRAGGHPRGRTLVPSRLCQLLARGILAGLFRVGGIRRSPVRTGECAFPKRFCHPTSILAVQSRQSLCFAAFHRICLDRPFSLAGRNRSGRQLLSLTRAEKGPAFAIAWAKPASRSVHPSCQFGVFPFCLLEFSIQVRLRHAGPDLHLFQGQPVQV